MSRCDEIRGLFSAYLEGELDAHDQKRVREHLAECPDCASLMDTLRMVIATGQEVQSVEPPASVAEEIGSSPCSRWQSMLFNAADRDLSADALPRLLEHLESCPTCRRTWDDLTLMHQVQQALPPPPGLVEKCCSVPFRKRRRVPHRIMGIRTATAAAYVLAILTTLTIGNPVTLARNEAGGVLHHTRTAVHYGIERLASDGRGELRLAVWRAWQWGERQVDAVRSMLGSDHTPTQKHTSSAHHQGGS